MHDLSTPLDHCFEPTLCFIGYASHEGVRANLGRIGAEDGPTKLRERMGSFPIVEGVSLVDCGDVRSAGCVLETQLALAAVVERVVRAGAVPVVLGGGHDQAFGLFLGIARASRTAPACINFDAHLDLRPIPAGGPNSGTPFTQAWEWCREKKAQFRYAALGVQRLGNTAQLFTRAEQAGATLVDVDGFALDMIDVVMDAVNDAVDDAEIALSIDLDVFAAAFAPGVSAPTAMGLAPDAAFRRVLRGLIASERVRGIEIAELCPVFDVDDRTARLGASLIFEIASTLGDGDEEEDTDADADEESEVDDPERQPSDEDRSDADDDGGPIDRF
jgi:formiminoglutamase